MASLCSQKLEEKLVCSICLELFHTAVTLPCGHNFCRHCISGHWDKQEGSGAEKGYSCPECRKCFEQRLELRKNVALCGVVELARAGAEGHEAAGAEGHEAAGAEGHEAAGAKRREVAHGGQCPQHGRPLELYCEDEQRCICCVCTVRQCQRHRRVLFEEAHAKKQALLKEALEKARQEAERIGQAMQELEEQTRSIKDSSETLKLVVVNKFDHLAKALEDCQQQMVARIEQEQAAALGQVEENWKHLKDCLDAFNHHKEKAQDLLVCTDKQTFLEEFPLLLSPESPEAMPPVEFNVGMVEPIAEILTDISKLLLENLPTYEAPKAADPVAPDPVQPEVPVVEKAVATLPQCQLRTELLKDHRNLTFDANTANRYLRLSSSNQKAKHLRSAESLRQEHDARFELWQVLCDQSYSHGHHYWEVKASSHSVIVGVTYGSISRKQQPGHKFNIGLDGGSWGLQVREDCYLAWHKGRSEKIQERLYKNLGVSLDYGNGLLSFYGLGDQTQLIHRFHHIFTEPLYPVFWLCEGRTITLCQRDGARALPGP